MCNSLKKGRREHSDLKSLYVAIVFIMVSVTTELQEEKRERPVKEIYNV